MRPKAEATRCGAPAPEPPDSHGNHATRGDSRVEVTLVEIPDPSLVVLVGAAGAGKSTFASRHFDPSEILSSDAYRALVSGDEADQSATRSAFAILHRELERRLKAGRLTVVDATNVQAHARHALLRRSRRHGIPAVAIILDLPESVVLSRNAARAGRTVAPDVVALQVAALHATLDDDRLSEEGFASLVFLRTAAEVDAIRLVR